MHVHHFTDYKLNTMADIGKIIYLFHLIYTIIDINPGKYLLKIKTVP